MPDILATVLLVALGMAGTFVLGFIAGYVACCFAWQGEPQQPPQGPA